MKKENIERDYKETLDTKFIERVGSPFKWEMPILGTGKSVKPIANKKILVIRLESCAELYALNNAVTYVTDSEGKYKKFLDKVNNEKFGSDDSAIMFNDWKNIDKLMENRKFDICIMNPPYEKSLHLKILEEVLSFCDRVVNISPIRWLQDPFAQEKRSELKRFENSICKKLKDVYTVSCLEASKLFNIQVYSDLGIYVSGSGFDYKNFWKALRSSNEISVLNKVCNSTDIKLSSVVENDKRDGIRTLITGIAGNRGTKPIYKELNYVIDGRLNGVDWTKLKNMGGYEKPENSPLPASIRFNSIVEAVNFYNSYKTKLISYVCKISCQQQHIQLQKLPFMQDYIHRWTDERLCEYFNITGYISDTEAEPGSEWETVLNTMS